MLKHLRPAFLMLFALTVMTGIAYPLLLTGLSGAFFRGQANGSLVSRDGVPVGSDLIAQPFHSPGYFWPRPSATDPPYNATASSGSNLGPTSDRLLEVVRDRLQALRDADPAHRVTVPVDLVTASGSGLDPDISLAGALYQAPRVARARRIAEDQVENLVRRTARGRDFGLLGEPRVDVLRLNLALDALVRP